MEFNFKRKERCIIITSTHRIVSQLQNDRIKYLFINVSS